MTERHRRHIVELLAFQHDRMRELLEDILEAEDGDRTDSFLEFRRWLAVHEATEAELLQTASLAG